MNKESRARSKGYMEKTCAFGVETAQVWEYRDLRHPSMGEFYSR